MGHEKRLSQRYKEIGKIEAPEICALSGVLDDISATGCKVHYSFPIVLDLDNEYEVKVSPIHQNDQSPLKLICTPQWITEQNENTFIGFKINYSPDVNRLAAFIEQLKELHEDQLPDII